MATYTTNLGLKKPAQSDKIRIADINNNMDDIDAAFGAVGNTSVATQLSDIRGGMAIVSNGNAHDAIAAGQFVYVMGHDTLDDGLYTANSALAANATLSSSNVTAVSGGGLNALNSKFIPQDITSQVTFNDEISVVAGGIYRMGKLIIGQIRVKNNGSSATRNIITYGLPQAKGIVTGFAHIPVSFGGSGRQGYIDSNSGNLVIDSSTAELASGASTTLGFAYFAS